MTRTAIVIGGGIAGLSAGIALRKASYGVTLYEQAPAIAPMGAALSIWGNAMAGLDWFGCGDAVRARAARVARLSLTTIEGHTLFGPADIAGCDSYLPLRTDLQAVLLGALGEDNVRLGTKIASATQTAGEVTVFDGEGAPVDRADLLVVADGINSAIATELLGNPPNYAGYGGVLSLVDAASGFDGEGGEIWNLAARDRFGIFDTGRGGYWFYMGTGTEADIAALDRATLIERARAYPPHVRDAVAASAPDRLIHVAIHSRPMPRTLGRGRIVCIGDAAHAMEPNQGQGACQGIEDAWALGVLAGRHAPDAIVPHLDRLRLKRIAGFHRDSALIGKVLHGESGVLRRIVPAIFRAVPRALDQWQLGRRLAPPDFA